MSAECHVAGRFRCVDANGTLKPLAIFVDQGNQCNGCFAQPCSEACEIVKLSFGSSVKNIALDERLQSLRFVGWQLGRWYG